MSHIMIGVIGSVIGPLSVWACWLVFGALITGIGLLARHALWRERKLDTDSLFTSFWLGVALVVLFLQVWHFFLPVSRAAFLVFVAAGVAGLVWHASTLTTWLRSIPSKAVWIFSAICAAAGWWFAGHAMAGWLHADTLMYHAPAVEWFKAQPLVPGLANLQPRFGYNNSSFLLAALLEGGPWVAGSDVLVNGLLIFPLFAQITHSLWRFPFAEGSRRVRCAFDAVLLAPVLAFAMSALGLLPGLNPIPASAIMLFAGLSLLAGRIRTRAEEEPAVGLDGVATALLVITTAVTFKITVAVVALAAWIIALVRLWRGDQKRTRAIVSVVLSVLLIGTWVGRSVMLSGYPLYPVAALGAPVDWKVPAEQVRLEAVWPRHFAWAQKTPLAGRYDPEHVCHPTRLLGVWWKSFFSPEAWWQVPLPLALAILIGMVGLRRKPRGGEARLFLVWFAVFVVAGVAWFIGAPRATHLVAQIWVAAAMAAAFAAFAATAAKTGGALAGTRGTHEPARRTRMYSRWRPVALALVLGVLPVVVYVVSPGKRVGGDWRLFTLPGEKNWFQVRKWHYSLTPRQTDSGLTLLISRDHRCGRSPLLCTSHFASNLRLRDPGDLRAGFAVGSVWKVENYPNPNSNFLTVWRRTQKEGCSRSRLRPPPRN